MHCRSVHPLNVQWMTRRRTSDVRPVAAASSTARGHSLDQLNSLLQLTCRHMYSVQPQRQLVLTPTAAATAYCRATPPAASCRPCRAAYGHDTWLTGGIWT